VGFSSEYLYGLVAQSLDKLASQVLDNGMFVYTYDDETKTPGKDDYNILRHCGTVWSMEEALAVEPVAAKVGDPTRIQNSLDSAVGYVVRERLKLVPSRHPDELVLCLVEGGRIKLGGNGLALLALLGANPAFLPNRLLLARGIANYYLQDPGRLLQHKVHHATGKATDFVSEYYTGEALFGLARIYTALWQATGDDGFRQEIISLLKWTARLKADDSYGVSIQSHWMVYAITELYHIVRTAGIFDSDPDEYAAMLLDYGWMIVDDVIRKNAYRKRNQSTPIACRSEALVRYALMLTQEQAHPCRPDSQLEKHSQLGKRLAAVITTLEENLTLQMKALTLDGAFVRGWNNRLGEREVRIDYIQHNMTSLLNYAVFLQQRG
jgi:hypothetical protein